MRLNDEVAVRMIPSMPKRSCTQKRGLYEHIQDRNLRACYVCVMQSMVSQGYSRASLCIIC